jgi:hypothetical protein
MSRTIRLAIWVIILALAGYSWPVPPRCLAQDAPRFTYRITDFQPMSTTYGRVKGLVTNNTNIDFREVIFNLVVYNEQGVVLGQAKFSLRNLTSGQTQQFTTTLHAKHKLIDHYRVDFISGTPFKKSS